MVNQALIQSILTYGIAFWGSAYQTYLNKMETTLNSLIKYLYYKPRLFAICSLYRELKILNITSLRLLYFCTLFFKYRSKILLPNHFYSTRFKFNTNLTISKSITCFAQFGLDYVFIYCSIQFKINPHNFYNRHHYKKTIIAIVFNIM
jgi:hypothetical protein